MDENADFIAKLQQIEEQASSLGAILPEGLQRARSRHIVLLARSLRGRVEFGEVNVLRTDRSAPDADAKRKPPS
jgi:hypothetical protein